MKTFFLTTLLILLPLISYAQSPAEVESLRGVRSMLVATAPIENDIKGTGLTDKEIDDFIKSQLGKIGIRFFRRELLAPYLIIEVDTIKSHGQICSVRVSLDVSQEVSLTRNPAQKMTVSTYRLEEIAPATKKSLRIQVVTAIIRLTDKLIDDYREANGK